MSRYEYGETCCVCSFVGLLMLGILATGIAGADDDAFVVVGVNKIVLPPALDCMEALVYAPDCGQGLRRLHSSGGHSTSGGHSPSGESSSTSGGRSSGMGHIVPSNVVAARPRVLATTAVVALLASQGLDVAGTTSDLILCQQGEVYNSTITHPGTFLALCTHDRIGFVPIMLLLLAICIGMLCVVSCCAYVFDQMAERRSVPLV